jgi:DMSO reductase anchor subunit
MEMMIKMKMFSHLLSLAVQGDMVVELLKGVVHMGQPLEALRGMVKVKVSKKEQKGFLH